MLKTFSVCSLLGAAFTPLSSCSTVRIGVTGDVNLDPFLIGGDDGDWGYPWGDTLSTTQALDAFFINHEVGWRESKDDNIINDTLTYASC